MSDTDELVEALAATRELNAAMAFGVPEEAWDDCRNGIAAALAPIVAARVGSCVMRSQPVSTCGTCSAATGPLWR